MPPQYNLNDIPVGAPIEKCTLGMLVLLRLPFQHTHPNPEKVWVVGELIPRTNQPDEYSLYPLNRGMSVHRSKGDEVYPITIDILDFHLTPNKSA